MEKLKSFLNKSEFFINKFVVPCISASMAIAFINLI